MHATVEEEQYYRDTGLIPLRFMNKPLRMERGKGPLLNGQPSLFPTENTAPVSAPPNPIAEPFPAQPTPEKSHLPSPHLPSPHLPDPHVHEPHVVEPHVPTPEPEPVVERSDRVERSERVDNKPDPAMEVEADPAPAKRQKLSYEELDIEINMLREKVKILEKKVEQLDAANEVLLEKNAKMRSSTKKSPERRRSPDKDHRSSRRRDGDRSRRSRSKDRARSNERAKSSERGRSNERGRSKDTQDSGAWRDNQNRGPGSRWNNDQYGNTNNAAHNHNRGPM